MINVQMTKSFQQRGTALIMCLFCSLICLVITTQIIQTTNDTVKMNASYQKKNQTFQVAEGATNISINQLKAGDLTLYREAVLADDATSSINTECSPDESLHCEFQVEYLTEIVLNSSQSLNADENSTLILDKVFEIKGVGYQQNGAQIPSSVRRGIILK